MKGLGEELFYKSRHLLDDRQGDLEEIEVVSCSALYVIMPSP